MSAILLALTGWDAKSWAEDFRRLAHDREIRVWPDTGNPADIIYACTWKPPHGLLAQLPNLKAIFNLGAGVDALLADPSLPPVPIVRAVDFATRMTEYVTLHVLMYHRRQRLYDAQQRARLWRDHEQPEAREVSVGIMGLGVLGREAGEVLSRIGFNVAGWSRQPKTIPGIATFAGADQLDRFLARTEILVALLPLTPETKGILNLALFRKLKRDGALGGAYLINAGRGQLQIESDILAALDEGSLAGATLDVFSTEPLPPESPLWTHPKVTITPHNAAASVPRQLVAYVLEQIARLEAGQPLQNVVDRARGY